MKIIIDILLAWVMSFKIEKTWILSIQHLLNSTLFVLISVWLNWSVLSAGTSCPLLSNLTFKYSVCHVVSLIHTHWRQEDRKKGGREGGEKKGRGEPRREKIREVIKEGGREGRKQKLKKDGREGGRLALMIQERKTGTKFINTRSPLSRRDKKLWLKGAKVYNWSYRRMKWG